MSPRFTLSPPEAIAVTRALRVCVALVTAGIVACSDQPTAPVGTAVSNSAASQDRFEVASAT